MVDKEKWLRGQLLEREWHDKNNKHGRLHYADTYAQYFHYVEIDDSDVSGIIEVGCADYPALSYCLNEGCYVIEPLPSDELKRICTKNDIVLIDKPAEEVEWPKARETWLFNVLQHVLDPDIIINKAKEATDVIRFFEPINLPVDQMHFHSFTMQYFYKHFGDCVRYYPKNPKAVNFHKWENAYGAWKKNT